MQLSKRETRAHIVCLSFPICETHQVSTRVSLLLALLNSRLMTHSKKSNNFCSTSTLYPSHHVPVTWHPFAGGGGGVGGRCGEYTVKFLFLYFLIKKEIHILGAHLRLLRCKTHLVSARLSSTWVRMVYKFSPTLSTRTYAHQLLNTQ
jgi:hypothetical protein